MSSRTLLSLGVACLCATLLACDDSTESSSDESAESPEGASTSELGEIVEAPFEVPPDLSGLMLTWFDEDGPHMASSKDDIPAERRSQVRLDSLELPPEQRDGDHVYVADVTGSEVVVRRYTRDSFDALVDSATGQPEPVAAAGGATHGTAGADVIVYGTSWCGACRQAERWLAQNGIPFQEKDVERDPDALAEMQQKARAAGIRPSGVPVIDARGTMLVGFDANAIQRALRRSTI